MNVIRGILVVLLLFSGAAWAGNYSINPGGTVTDNLSGLLWQQEDDSVVRSWEAAISYCEGLSLAGQTDWRLPNVKELASLTDESRFNPVIDLEVFPGAKASQYWSSTAEDHSAECAWQVHFDGGDVNTNLKSCIVYTRCVRGGQ